MAAYFKHLLYILIITVSTIIGKANSTKNNSENSAHLSPSTSTNYNRVALTPLLLDHSPPAISEFQRLKPALLKNMKVSDKYDDHSIAIKEIKISDTLPKEVGIRKIEIPDEVGRKIIAKWFNRKKDGSFDMELIASRGLYSATDAEYRTALDSKRKTARLEDSGLELINNSYIVVYSISNIKYVQYDRYNAYNASSRVWVYKVDFNEEIAAIFYNDLWIDDATTDEEKKKRKEAFDNFKFPIKKVFYKSFQPIVTDFFLSNKSKKELAKDLILHNFERSMHHIEKSVNAFKVKSFIASIGPIEVKIGKKEGMKRDDKYLVYEKRETKKYKKYDKLIGSIKAKEVADNQQAASGETPSSTFYQTSGKKIDNMGMFVVQQKELKLGAAFEYNLLGEMGIVAMRLEGNIPTSVKVFIETGISVNKYEYPNPHNYSDFENREEHFVFLRGSLGLAKEFWFLRNFHFAPLFGGGVELFQKENVDGYNPYSSEIENESWAVPFLQSGARFGVSLLHNLQLIASFNAFLFFSPSGKVNGANVSYSPSSYRDIFPERAKRPYSLGVGFRYQF